jgi:hypothetical protein
MRRGARTVKRLCPCGCGRFIKPNLHPDGTVNVYPKFIPGHGSKDWGRRWKQRLKEIGHPQAVPVGTKRISDQGYVEVKTIDGWDYEHRVVMSTHIGRSLQTHEHVHHRNDIRTDNRIENLVVVSNAEHRRLHRITQWSKTVLACINCGKTEHKHQGHGLCVPCYLRIKRSHRNRH